MHRAVGRAVQGELSAACLLSQEKSRSARLAALRGRCEPRARGARPTAGLRPGGSALLGAQPLTPTRSLPPPPRFLSKPPPAPPSTKPQAPEEPKGRPPGRPGRAGPLRGGAAATAWARRGLPGPGRGRGRGCCWRCWRCWPGRRRQVKTVAS